MKIIYFLMLSVVLLSCENHIKTSSNTKTSQTNISELNRQKDKINASYNTNNLIILAKIPGKDEPVKVINNQWPEDTECAYNVLKDKEGKVITIISSPTSESGDWDLEALHYFNNNGQTFIFEVKAKSFALPDNGVASETTTRYFDTDFKLIKSNYKLIDKAGKALDKKIYAFEAESRGIDVTAYPNVAGCLKAYHIKL